jgi:integrase/recombinase XerD
VAGSRVVIANVEAYLALRRATGYSMRGADLILRSFGRFAEARHERYVRVGTVHDWARRARSPERREALVRKVAAFARHLHVEDPRHEIPAYRLFASDPFRRPVPFIFSGEQIVALVSAAQKLRHGETFATLIALLAATGLRISEALALRLDDLTVDGLRVRETKCHKSRLVPLHASVERGLARYLKQRATGTCDQLFLGFKGGALSYARVKLVFAKLLGAIGIERKTSGPRPRLHCLRHTFAVRSLQRCIDPSTILEHQLALATYLGHSTVTSTYWYLEATPELLDSIARRCERFARTS